MQSELSEQLTLSQKLKQFRKVKHLSQEELSAASGISSRTIQRLENGDSVGSAYTLKKLSDALGIDSASLNDTGTERNADTVITLQLNRLNMSALGILIFPLLNIFIPLFLLRHIKTDPQVKSGAGRIISFQVWWTLCSLLVVILLPGLLMQFKALRGGSIPLAVLVYYACVLVNIVCILRISVAISAQRPFLQRVPRIL